MNFIQRFFCNYFGLWCPPKKSHTTRNIRYTVNIKSLKNKSKSKFKRIRYKSVKGRLTQPKTLFKTTDRNILDMLTDVAEEYRGKGGKTKRRRRIKIN
jgi:hypothetical protein